MDKKETIEKLKNIVKPYIKNQEAFENLSESTDFATLKHWKTEIIFKKRMGFQNILKQLVYQKN